MAVYSGFPSIRLEGDETRALSLVPQGKALLYRVQSFREASGTSTFSMSRRVDDDSTIYVLSSMDQHLIHIAVAPAVPERINPEEEELEPTEFPDFYSGSVSGGFLEERVRDEPDGSQVRYTVCTGFTPTPTCVDTHEELSAGRQDVQRLSVRPWIAFDELRNQGTGPEFSQYTKLRSSMYSGTMKKVVQITMGLGRIRKSKMRGPRPEYPDSRYIKDVGDKGVQVRFDWRFVRTHGITIAEDGRLWLIEISIARGVLARPLPIFPDSDFESFLSRANAREDSAMVYALEQLGCLPTGEAFPNTISLVNELVDSGDILRLLWPEDLVDFYSCSAYSSVMGWAFNERGTEAHNTAYRYGDDGFQRGVWYQLNIRIGATREVRQPNEPIASGNASLRLNYEGFIYTPPVRGNARYVPIKFHEPMLPGLLSHEGVPLPQPGGLPPAPHVDTPMFVSFVDDDLKVVRFYNNPRKSEGDTEDDPRYPGECLLAGSWTITRTSGPRSIPAMMYSNDFDDRRTLPATRFVQTIASEDLGYDPPRFTDFLESPEAAYVFRIRYFRRTTSSRSEAGEILVAAVVIPEYSREAYYYATGTKFTSFFETRTVGFDSIRDPNVGYAWRCFPRIGPPPFPAGRPDCNTTVCRGDAPCSFGGVGFHKERRVVCTAYESSGGCSDFADGGSWLDTCQIVDNFNQPGSAKVSSSSSQDFGEKSSGELYLISPGHGGPLRIPVTGSQVFNHWMNPSPAPLTHTIQRISATHSAIGNDALVYKDHLSTYAGSTVLRGYSPANVGPDDSVPTFIGVNKP